MSRFIECQQGTELWHSSRSGLITASRFADAISTVGGLDAKQQKYVDAVRDGASEKEAAQVAGYKAAPASETIKRALRGESTVEASDIAKRYAADLAIEIVSGQQWGIPAKAWVLERGHIMEAEARRIYEARTGAFVTEAGICVDDAGYGYSSDGLIESDGLMEVKAPIDSVKIMEMWRTGDTSEYDHQMQGGLWITNRKWIDFLMYVPSLASVGKDLYLKRIYRNEEFIDNMVTRLAKFHQLVQHNVAVLRAPAPLIITSGEDMTKIEDAEKAEIAAAAKLEADHAEALEMNAAWVSTVDETVVGLPAEDTRPVITVELEEAAPPPVIEEPSPPTLRLGQIGTLLGFNLTADQLRALGFEPAGRDKAAVLYHEHNFPNICVALIERINAAKLAWVQA